MRSRAQAPRRLLTPGEVDALKAEIREAKMTLNSPDLVDMQGSRAIWAPNQQESASHQGNASHRLAHLTRVLEQGTVHDFTKSAKNKIEKGIKEMEELVSKNLAPREYFYAKREDNKDYHKTVNHLVEKESSPEHQANVQKLKNLYLAREQAGSQQAGSVQNPNSGSIEHLRK